jgi:hypothetical protein
VVNRSRRSSGERGVGETTSSSQGEPAEEGASPEHREDDPPGGIDGGSELRGQDQQEQQDEGDHEAVVEPRQEPLEPETVPDNPDQLLDFRGNLTFWSA